MHIFTPNRIKTVFKGNDTNDKIKMDQEILTQIRYGKIDPALVNKNGMTLFHSLVENDYIGSSLSDIEA